MMQIKEPAAPATTPQINFLNSLTSERDNQTVAERYRLMAALGGVTKGQASAWITELMASPKKTGQTNTVQDWGQAQAVQVAAAPAAQLTELPAFGYYAIDGTIYYWDVTGKDAYPVLRKLAIVENYSYATGTYVKKGSWKKVYGSYNDPKVTGTFKPYGGKGYNAGEKTTTVRVPKVLAEAVLGFALPMTQAETAKLGKQFGFCVRCGATLTDPVSVANGIGPVCAKYWA